MMQDGSENDNKDIKPENMQRAPQSGPEIILLSTQDERLVFPQRINSAMQLTVLSEHHSPFSFVVLANIS